MNVSGSTVGPPENLHGLIGQNGIVYASSAAGKPGGTVQTSTIFGNGDATQDVSTDTVIMQGAKNVTITNNTVTSDPSQVGTDVGIWVLAGSAGGSTGIVISNNHITRSTPDVPDPVGVGVIVCSSNEAAVVAQCGPVDAPSSATLICNTFAMWKTNILGAIQIGCTPLPEGGCGKAYSAPALAVEGGTAPFTWSASGALPPGLKLATTGAITGTPTKAGTYPFTAHVVDSSHPPLTAAQSQSITIAAGTCTEETGENPAIPEASEPGEAGVAPITPVTVPVTG